MITRKIRLPLDRKVKRYLSSDNYGDSVEQAFNLLDALYTYFFRYPMLLEELQGAMGSHSAAVEFIASNPIAGVGLTLILGAAAAASLISEYRKQSKAAEEKAGTYQSSYKRITDRLQNKLPQVDLIIPSVTVQNIPSHSGSNLSEEKYLDYSPLSSEEDSTELATPLLDNKEASREKTLNEHIEELRQKDENLKKKYKQITVTADGQVEFSLNEVREAAEEKPGLLKRIAKKAVAVVSASWIALGLCSFAYWILWIGCGVVTGSFAPVGIDGLSTAGFAVPLAVGALYPIIKIRNWWKNNYGKKTEKQNNGEQVQIEEDPRLVLAAAADVSKLLEKAIFADEKARLRRELEGFGVSSATLKIDADESYLSGDEKIKMLGQDKWKKTATTFVATTVSTYIMAQYGAWIVTDILKAAADISLSAAGFSLGIGIAFMVCSAAYGAYKAYQRHQEVKKYAADIEKQELRLNTQVSTLEKTYEAKVKRIEELKGEIFSLARNSHSDLVWLSKQARQITGSTLVAPDFNQKTEPSNWWTKTKKVCSRAYAFFGGITTGAMIARMATISGSAIFLPFAAVALATPYTIGIVVAVGVVYGLFKAYQYHQARKEARAKELFEKRAEKIETLKEQSEVADLQIKLLNAKKAELLGKVAANPEVEEKAATSPKPGFRVKACDDSPNAKKRVDFNYAASGQSIFAKRSQDDLDTPRLSAAFQYQLAAA